MKPREMVRTVASCPLGLLSVRLTTASSRTTVVGRGSWRLSLNLVQKHVDAVWLLTKISDTHLRLECGYTRPQLDTKLLKIARCSEPLRHELEGAAAITTPEAKILELIKLCDNDDLPDDANRDAVRDVAKRHGMKSQPS